MLELPLRVQWGQRVCSWCCWSAHLGVAVTRLGVWLSSQGVVHCGRCPAGHQVLLQQIDWCTHLTGVLTLLQCRMPVSMTSGHLAPALFWLLSRCMVVQLWKLPSLTPGLVLRGHKRGVWAVAFAPVDRVRPPVPQPVYQCILLFLGMLPTPPSSALAHASTHRVVSTTESCASWAVAFGPVDKVRPPAPHDMPCTVRL